MSGRSNLIGEGFSLYRDVVAGVEYTQAVETITQLGMKSRSLETPASDNSYLGRLKITDSVSLVRFADGKGADVESVESTELEDAEQALFEEVPDLYEPLIVTMGGLDALFANRVMQLAPDKTPNSPGSRLGACIRGFEVAADATSQLLRLRRERLLSHYSLADLDRPEDVTSRVKRKPVALNVALGYIGVHGREELTGKRRERYQQVAENCVRAIGPEPITVELGPARISRRSPRPMFSVRT